MISSRKECIFNRAKLIEFMTDYTKTRALPSEHTLKTQNPQSETTGTIAKVNNKEIDNEESNSLHF